MKTLALLLIVLFSTTIAFAQKNSEKYNFPQETRSFLKGMYPGINSLFVIDESKVEKGKKFRKDRYLSSYTDAKGKSFIDEAVINENDDVLVYEKKAWFNATTQQLLLRDQSSAASTQSGKMHSGQGLEKIVTIGSLLLNVGGTVMNEIDRRSNYGYSTGRYSSRSSGVQTVNMRY